MIRHKEFLASDFEEVNELIRESLDPNGIIVNDSSYELFQYGGKKIRPTFTLLVGRLGERHLHDDVIRAGASLELIHMASLVHDDIIDDSKLRRGQDTVFYEHGYLQAVNTGNYLLSTSLELVGTIEHEKLHDAFSAAMKDIVSGELFQFDQQFNAEQTLDDYYKKIYRKTALLIELSIEMGAYAARVKDEDLDALLKYGYHIGMSFQIIDDCLDFTGDEKNLGKPKFSDLENGHYTLPVLLLKDSDPLFKEKLSEFREDRSIRDSLIRQLLSSDAIPESIRISGGHIEEAKAAIKDIDEPIRTYLFQIAEKLANRLN
ncbi:polyprenyl synthetase family protein [Salinicoccus carnicancri]|uniref:polyprenyl synthetase family protein n=1 Tax=Salinicoccus carnicancri TaxID=558170 RepID=UPI0002FC0ED8|nr:polyprenyl synthetase family protein [Salinicoccus carnicancri]